jgi:hypothetical protein
MSVRAIVVIAVGLLAFVGSCYTGNPPWPGHDPTQPPAPFMAGARSDGGASGAAGARGR